MRKKWSSRDMIVFLESLELYMGAGLVLNESVRVIAESQTSHKKKAIDLVRERVEQGGLFSDALVHAVRFDATVVGLIRHGELSGTLVNSIARARAILEQRDELIKKCTSALIYPLVIGFFAGVMVIGLVRGVMPQIIPMLVSLHVPLPLLTRVVIWISNALVTYGLYALVGLVAGAGMLIGCYRKVRAFKSVVQKGMVCVPFVGKLRKDFSVALFLQSAGVLLDSGISIDDAYRDTVKTMTLMPLRNYFETHSKRISEGMSFGTVFGSGKFPQYIPSLLLAGSASGTLGASCLRAAHILDRDIQHSLKRMTSLIEPVMMVCMGLVIGSIALSIMMPIYSISSVLQH